MNLHIGICESSGKNFCLPLELTTQSVAILAKRGVGKSYTSAVMVEELLDAGQVPVIIDPTGAHWGLKSMANAKTPGYKVVVFGGEHADLPLEETAGETIAAAIVEQRFPAIIDLSLMRKGQVRRFMTPFLETLYRLNRLPLMLVVDEADDICPQKCGPEEAQMVGAMEDVVKRGRKKGIGCTLITQRPADLAKQVLTQCEMLVAMRLVHPLDIRAVMEWVNVHADRETAARMIESLPTLPIGTAWFWSPGWGDIFERVKIRARRTFDSGATPKPGQQKVEPSELAKIDIAALGEKIVNAAVKARWNEPEFLKGEIRKLKADLAKITEQTSFPTEPVKVPILTDADRKQLDRLSGEINELQEAQSKAANHLQSVTDELMMLRTEIDDRCRTSGVQLRTASMMASSELPPPTRPRGKLEVWAEPGTKKFFSLPVSKEYKDRISAMSLPKGERAVLTACAQHADTGCTREQLTVLTGYKRSSRDAYLQRLRERGLIETDSERITATAAGIAALGTDFEPLPTGDALCQHWLARLPEGERNVLSLLVGEYPNAVPRDQISSSTQYKRSSRDAYVQRLSARQLVTTGSDGVRASPILFS